MSNDSTWEEIGKLAKDYLTAYHTAVDPRTDSAASERFSKIRKTLAEDGIWKESDEWRISTCTDIIIELSNLEKPKYKVTVSCDGQIFKCESPVLWRAIIFADFYAHLITQIFYNIAPPWAGEAHGYREIDAT